MDQSKVSLEVARSRVPICDRAAHVGEQTTASFSSVRYASRPFVSHAVSRCPGELKAARLRECSRLTPDDDYRLGLWAIANEGLFPT